MNPCRSVGQEAGLIAIAGEDVASSARRVHGSEPHQPHAREVGRFRAAARAGDVVPRRAVDVEDRLGVVALEVGRDVSPAKAEAAGLPVVKLHALRHGHARPRRLRPACR
jgi:hypothetical protein